MVSYTSVFGRREQVTRWIGLYICWALSGSLFANVAITVIRTFVLGGFWSILQPLSFAIEDLGSDTTREVIERNR